VDGSQEQRLTEGYKDNLVFNRQANIIFWRLPYAPLGYYYRVQWQLRDRPPPAGRGTQRLVGDARKAYERLIALAKSPREHNPLRVLITAIEAAARKEFRLDARDNLDLIMMAPDRKEKLHVVASNLPLDNPAWDVVLDYGDGIAGRAYKMNRVSLFIKARARESGTPFYYMLPSGDPVSETGDEIPVEALLSMPLSHPDQPEAIFAILNIASNQVSSRLLDISEDSVTTEFRRGVSEACFKAIKGLDS
jgi:hypothetical protein